MPNDPYPYPLPTPQEAKSNRKKKKGKTNFIEEFLSKAKTKQDQTKNTIQDAIETALTKNVVDPVAPLNAPHTRIPGIQPNLQQDMASVIAQIGTPVSQGTVRAPITPVVPAGESPWTPDSRGLNGPGIENVAVDGRDSIMDRINQILNNPTTTPDRWVSPYSQGQLNLMGNLLSGTGQRLGQEYLDAIPEILSTAQQGLDQRSAANTAFTNELATNAANLDGRSTMGGREQVVNPINYAQGAAAQELAASAGFLDEVGRQNTQADVSYNQNLSSNIRQALEMQAQLMKAGLLTEKQFIPGDSGMSEADKIRLSMLQDELGALDSSSEDTSELEEWIFKQDYGQGLDKDTLLFKEEIKKALGSDVSDEDFRSQEFENALIQLAGDNPELHGLIENYYFSSGRDLDNLAKLVGGSLQAPPELPDIKENPEILDLLKGLDPRDPEIYTDPNTTDALRSFMLRRLGEQTPYGEQYGAHNQYQNILNFLEPFLYSSRVPNVR